MMSVDSQDQKTAIIVGAGGRGMGYATTEAILAAGINVVAIDFADENITQVIKAAEELGRRATGVLADVQKREEFDSAISEALRIARPVDYLVNIAGGAGAGDFRPAEEYPFHLFDAQLDLNLRYVYRASARVGKNMIEHGIRGSIVNFASVSGLVSAPYHLGYGIAKAGVSSLTRTMALEWGQYGIRVNAVAPGSVRSLRPVRLPTGELEFRDRQLADEFNSDLVPLRRRLEPREIASVVLFLLSDEASAITGQIINVDGGMSVRSVSGELSEFAKRR